MSTETSKAAYAVAEETGVLRSLKKRVCSMFTEPLTIAEAEAVYEHKYGSPKSKRDVSSTMARCSVTGELVPHTVRPCRITGNDATPYFPPETPPTKKQKLINEIAHRDAFVVDYVSKTNELKAKLALMP